MDSIQLITVATVAEICGISDNVWSANRTFNVE